MKTDHSRSQHFPRVSRANCLKGYRFPLILTGYRFLVSLTGCCLLVIPMECYPLLNLLCCRKKS